MQEHTMNETIFHRLTVITQSTHLSSQDSWYLQSSAVFRNMVPTHLPPPPAHYPVCWRWCKSVPLSIARSTILYISHFFPEFSSNQLTKQNCRLHIDLFKLKFPYMPCKLISFVATTVLYIINILCSCRRGEWCNSSLNNLRHKARYSCLTMHCGLPAVMICLQSQAGHKTSKF